MSFQTRAITVLLTAWPALAAAQATSSPVADAFRTYESRSATKLVAALEAMPADKYGYKPTDAQMTVAAIAVHLAQGNDLFCSNIGGTAAPTREAVDASAGKEKLMARLRETFDFCQTALAKLDDSGLGEQIPFFGDRKATRATVILVTTGDWEDHYSQLANYLRLNGVLPPTARRQSE